MSSITSGISQLAASLSSEGALFVLNQNRTDRLQEALRGWSFDLHCATVTPVGAGDYFCVLHNISTDPIIVDNVTAEDAVAQDWWIMVGAQSAVPTSVAPAAFTCNNVLAGSTNVYTTKALAYCDTDATAFSLALHEKARMTCAAATRFSWDLTRECVILGQGQLMALAVETGAGAITNLHVRYRHVMTPAVSS